MTNNNSTVGYQFTPMPKKLTHILDVNLRSMLFALIDASNYFADEDGWFFRTNDQLHLDSDLSKNLVIATIDTLFQRSLVEVSCSGTGKGRKPNNYRVNLDSFKFFEQLDMNTDLHRPENKIETVKYSGSGYHATYLDEEPVRYLPELVKGRIVWNPVNHTRTSTPDNTTVPTTDTTKELTTNVTKIEHNIDNINNIYNKEYIDNIDNLNNIEYVNNKDNIESNNNKLSINNNILNENSERDDKELVRAFEEGMTEPMTRNEEEGKEDPSEYQVNEIPTGDNQDFISSGVQAEGAGESSPCQSQSNDEETAQQQEEDDSSAEHHQPTIREEFNQWKIVVAPELENLKHAASREDFHRMEKKFYQFYDGKVEETGFYNERVKKLMDSHIGDFISTWEYNTITRRW